jgi:diguanylate cyclase (GGDEF)-like protein/PAS domain S-box-containing protein
MNMNWFRHQLLALVVLGVSLGVTYLLWQHERHNAVLDRQASFDFNLRDISSRIEQRMAAYEKVLRGAQGLLATSDKVERQEFKIYIDALHLNANFFGIQGIGIVQAVPAAARERHIASLRRQGLPDYAIEPPGKRDLYAPIVQLEPAVGRNLRVIGYDPYTDPVRREAMEQARDSGNAAISAKVQMLPDNHGGAQPGFLMFLPVYKNGSRNETPMARRANLVGWVFAPFRMHDLMASLYGEHAAGVDIAIYDGVETREQTLMYDSGKRPEAPADSAIKAAEYIDIAGHTWTIAIRSRPGFGNEFSKDKSHLIAIAGVGLSLLLALLTWQQATARSRAIALANEMTVELRESEELWKFALEGSGDGVRDWNVQRGVVLFSARWKQILGYAEHEIGDSPDEWSGRIHPDDLADAMTDLDVHLERKTPTYISEYRLQCKDGSWKWVLDRGMVVNRSADGKPLRMICTLSDISERKATEERISHMAQHDTLTDLPNRALFSDRLRLAIAKASRNRERLAMMFIDLDKFKPVNDTYGHAVGDLLLREVAHRLQHCVRESDTVGRIGGDEFVVLLPAIESERDALSVAAKIQFALNQPFVVAGHVLSISSSIGVAIYPDHGTDEMQLAKCADDAMYLAKESGRNNVKLGQRPQPEAVAAVPG